MDELTINPKPRFAPRDWLTLALGLALALLWREVFSVETMFGGDEPALPALGASVFTFAAWAAALLAIGERARRTRANAFASVCILVLAVGCAFQSNVEIRFLSFFVILAGSVLCFLSLAGVGYYDITEPRALTEGLYDALRGCFKNWGRPFAALGALAPGDRRSLGGVALGLLLGVPLLIVITAGLASADEVFGSIFAGLFEWLDGLDAATVTVRVLWTAVLTLCFFSALYFLRHEPRREEGQTRMKPLPVSALVTILVLVTAVCALFAAVQFRYLFGGAEPAAMSGGWAGYARSGFFALVRTAAVVCCVALGCSRASSESAAARILTLALVLLTFVMLASAAYRLYLYILAYGLSVARVMAAWAIAAIGVCVALVGVRAVRPGFRFWPHAAAIVLVLWTLFCFVPVNGLVADYNVGAYLDGRLDSVDVTYLYGLGPDALGPLRELRDSGLEWNDGRWPDSHLDTLIRDLESDVAPHWTAIVAG